MLKRGLVSVKGSTRPAVRLHQLAHNFAEYHSSRKACRSEFIIRQTDQKVGATEYRVDDVDHPQRLMVEVGDGGPGLQGGPQSAAHGLHQQGQTVNVRHHLNAEMMLLANCLQPAAQAMALAWHNQRQGGELVRGDVVLLQGGQQRMGANQEQAFFQHRSGAPAQDLFLLENDS